MIAPLAGPEGFLGHFGKPGAAGERALVQSGSGTTVLDHFSILTQGGLVLWSKSFTPSPSPFDSLIRSALIEERSSSSSSSSPSSTTTSTVSKWDHEGYSLLWTLANELELVFVVAYQRILHLAYAEDLVQAVKRAFLAAFEGTVQAIVGTTKGRDVEGSAGVRRRLFSGTGEGWARLFKGWEDTFARILREFELAASKNKRIKPPQAPQLVAQDSPPSSDVSASQTPALDASAPPLDSATIARNIAALKARQKAKGSGPGSRGGTPTKGTPAPSGSEAEEDSKKTTPAKKVATKWADSKVSAADLAAYDYSSDVPSSGTATPLSSLVSSAALGTRSKSGLYEVADYDVRGGGDSSDSDDDDLPLASSSSNAPKPKSTFSALLAALSLSPRSLSSSDLAPALAAMKEHLMAKNVAADIASQVCDGVGKSLQGRSVSSFSSIKKEVKLAIEASLVKILTPKSSTDLLLDISRKKDQQLRERKTGSKAQQQNLAPYSLTFVGVNGVGKSTNLSKVAFWLLQNKLRVLIAACDTFRSGAVEQLRVHVRNLGRLGEETGGVGEVQGGVKMVELFERGYGKDAAGIAKDAIAYGKEQGFDVVLIDTAGRMQDNEPLMRALAKLVTVNNPDKIVFVGEALVGNEAVDQLTKFNRSLRDFSAGSNPRGIDGMILTKFDTIDDKVGAALSMTYVTGQPILFVGTGQTYSDLRSLRPAPDLNLNARARAFLRHVQLVLQTTSGRPHSTKPAEASTSTGPGSFGSNHHPFTFSSPTSTTFPPPGRSGATDSPSSKRPKGFTVPTSSDEDGSSAGDDDSDDDDDSDADAEGRGDPSDAELPEADESELPIPEKPDHELSPSEALERAEERKTAGNALFAKKDYPSATRLYSQAIALNPLNPAYLTNRAASYMAAKQFSRALEDCLKAAQLQSASPQPKTLLRLARCQLALGLVVQAQQTLDQLLPLDASQQVMQERARAARIAVHVQNVKRELAKGDWSMVLLGVDAAAREVDETPREWRLWKVEALVGKKRYDEVNSMAADLLRGNPNQPDALYYRGLSMYYQGNHAQAIAHAQAALRTDPDYVLARTLLRKVKLLDATKDAGNEAFKTSQFTLAIEKYTECMAIDPENETFRATVLSNRATAYLKAKEYVKATEDCDECLRLSPSYFKALRTRARVQLATEEWEGALRDFKAAYELAPAGTADETGLKREVKDAEAKLKKSKMKDHYKTLGTHSEATEDEIKKAYRKSSLIHHPDKGGTDEKFKEVGEAYAILSDPVRRRKFDAGIDESDPMSGMGSDFGDMGGFPGHGHGHGGGFGGGMNYEDLFGGGGGGYQRQQRSNNPYGF
ncbi:hypothetical protein RQP46_010138 [Phenoliferia psychrophenolica]